MNSSIDPTINAIITKGEALEKEMEKFTEEVKTLIEKTLENCGINGDAEINWEFKNLGIYNLTLRKQEGLIYVQSIPFIGRFATFSSYLSEMDFGQILSVSDLLSKAKKQGIVPTITKI